MYRLRLVIIAAAALAPSGIVRAQVEAVPAESFLAQNARRDGESEFYERGQSAVDAGRWDRAVEAFTQAAAAGGPHADGALYWKAYTLNKLGRRGEAIATLKQLKDAYSGSRWMDDAKALEIEMRQSSGQNVNPEAQADEELKLLALTGLMNSNPDKALPLLEKFLHGNQTPKLKERALFVLAQSDNAKGREILARAARDASDPDMQMKAIHYLGVMGSHENRQLLSELYAGSNDNVKRAVLHAFMVSGDRDHLLQAAKSEKNSDLRMEAIHQLGISGGQAELWQLYQNEPTVEVKETILHSMFVGGNGDKLIEIARTEKDPRLREAAIHSLGIMGGDHTGPALVSMYNTETNAGIRRAILNGLFIQGNAKAMIELARKETNPEMKKEIVQKLAVMGSPDATEYMMEILNK